MSNESLPEKLKAAIAEPNCFILHFENKRYKQKRPDDSKEHFYIILPSKGELYILEMISSRLESLKNRYNKLETEKAEYSISNLVIVKQNQIVGIEGFILNKDTSVIDCNRYVKMSEIEILDQINLEIDRVYIDPELYKELVTKVLNNERIPISDKKNINQEYIDEKLKDTSQNNKTIIWRLRNDIKTNETINIENDITSDEGDDDDPDNGDDDKPKQ